MDKRAAGPSRVRIRAIQKLGGHCECCGETTPEFLEIDHKNQGGRTDRKLLRRRGDAWLRRIISGTAGSGLRLLCSNCHVCITRYAHCVHPDPEEIGV